MKLSPAILAVVSNVNALTQDEMSAFGCRMGQPHVQHSVGQPTGATAVNKYATADNFDGCHEKMDLPCYRTEVQCSMSMEEVTSDVDGMQKIEIISNAIPDHYAYGFTPGGTVEEAIFEYRLPKVPVLRANGEYSDAALGTIGFALNGVGFFSPYNGGCIDVSWSELNTLDYCFGHPAMSLYHYHVMSMGQGLMAGSGQCPMGCQAGEVSGILGVVIDGFPLYGPMQYYNPNDGKIYMNKCDDCVLKQLYQDELDECGGQEVADGSAEDGTNYRYVVTNHFPYLIQCIRGDLGMTESNNDGPGGGTGPGGSGGPPTGGPGGSGGPPTGGPGGSGGPPTGGPPGGPGRRRRSARWSIIGTGQGCAINNGDVFDRAYTNAQGCSVNDCGEFSTLYFGCPGCTTDDCVGEDESTTEKPETTEKPDSTEDPATEDPSTDEPPTTAEPTTEPFNPETDCGFENGTGAKELVQWKGKNNGKVIAYSDDSAIIRFNYFNTAKYDIVEGDYIGFLGIPKKFCGIDLLNKIDDGNVTMTFNDYGAYYKGQAQYLRQDKAHTVQMVQMYRKKVAGENDLGSSKKDQVWIAMAGLSKVDFGTKDWKDCLESIQAGTMEVGTDVDKDWTPCVSWDINLGFNG